MLLTYILTSIPPLTVRFIVTVTSPCDWCSLMAVAVFVLSAPDESGPCHLHTGMWILLLYYHIIIFYSYLILFYSYHYPFLSYYYLHQGLARPRRSMGNVERFARPVDTNGLHELATSRAVMHGSAPDCKVRLVSRPHRRIQLQQPELHRSNSSFLNKKIIYFW